MMEALRQVARRLAGRGGIRKPAPMPIRAQLETDRKAREAARVVAESRRVTDDFTAAIEQAMRGTPPRRATPR